MKNYEEERRQNEYLRKQLRKSMREQRRNFHSTPSSLPSDSNQEEEEEDSNPFASCSEEDHARPRRNRRASNHFSNFKVEMPEFEGWLDPNEFLEWLQTVERVFEYRDVPQDKKVKLVALKIRKYASFWWENVIKKRAKQGKSKIRN